MRALISNYSTDLYSAAIIHEEIQPGLKEFSVIIPVTKWIATCTTNSGSCRSYASGQFSQPTTLLNEYQEDDTSQTSL